MCVSRCVRRCRELFFPFLGSRPFGRQWWRKQLTGVYQIRVLWTGGEGYEDETSQTRMEFYTFFPFVHSTQSFFLFLTSKNKYGCTGPCTSRDTVKDTFVDVKLTWFIAVTSGIFALFFFFWSPGTELVFYAFSARRTHPRVDRPSIIFAPGATLEALTAAEVN